MKRAAVSDLKAKLAKYLRLVKGGEEVEIQERGIPIAVIRSLPAPQMILEITPPRKDPAALGKKRFSIKPKKSFDVVELLIQERSKE